VLQSSGRIRRVFVTSLAERPVFIPAEKCKYNDGIYRRYEKANNHYHVLDGETSSILRQYALQIYPESLILHVEYV